MLVNSDRSFVKELLVLCYWSWEYTSFCRIVFPVSNFDQLLTIEANNYKFFFWVCLRLIFSEKILVKTIYLALSISLTKKCLVSFRPLNKEFHQPFLWKALLLACFEAGTSIWQGEYSQFDYIQECLSLSVWIPTLLWPMYKSLKNDSSNNLI